MATANNDVAAGAKAGSIGSQPSDSTAQLIRSAKTTHRVHGRPLLEQMRLFVQVSSGHTVKDRVSDLRIRRRQQRLHTWCKCDPEKVC